MLVLGAARSGWKRGFTFFTIDLIGFVLAVLAAVRFHEIPAIAFSAVGVSNRWATFLGGLAIFVPLIVVTAKLGSRASKAVYRPGLFTTNRVVGAAVAATFALTAAIVGLLFLQAAPIPFGIGGLVADSSIAPRVISTVEPGIAALDQQLGLDLCGGRLAAIIPETCQTPDSI